MLHFYKVSFFMKYYHGRVRSSMKAKSSCTLPNKMVNCWRGLTDGKKKNKCSFLCWGRPERDWISEWKNLLCQCCSVSGGKKKELMKYIESFSMLRHSWIVLFLSPPSIAFLKMLLPSEAPRGACSYNREMFPLWLRGTCSYCQERVWISCVLVSTCAIQ